MTPLATMFYLNLAGCERPRGVEKHIGAYIEKNCAGRWPFVINLREATPFTWDKMYVFKITASRLEIERAIGTKLANYQEISRYFIFTKSGSVVYSEDEPTNPEHPIKNEIVFEMPDSATYQVYGADVSLIVSQESSKAGPYYLSRPTK